MSASVKTLIIYPNGSQPRTDIVSRFVSKDSFATQAEDSLPLGCCMSLLQRHLYSTSSAGFSRSMLELMIFLQELHDMDMYQYVDMTNNDSQQIKCL